VELMIVVSILGILAAIVLPEFQGHAQQAKEAQAKANLRSLREAIERYATEHGVAPGYIDNNPNGTASASEFFRQIVTDYLPEMPKNPFNGYNGLRIYANIQPFPTEPDGTSGWCYKPQTREIRLNWNEPDSEGNSFFTY
jgi:type II secretory pathway pseudopilin PulG